MDVAKLTPAPWEADEVTARNWYVLVRPFGAAGYEEGCDYICQSSGNCDETDVANMRFIALARNAFEVMMRRGWSPERMGDTWIVNDEDARAFCYPSEVMMRWPDPFTALVEADKWYRENVEANCAPPAQLTGPVAHVQFLVSPDYKPSRMIVGEAES